MFQEASVRATGGALRSMLWRRVLATAAKSGQPTSHHVAEALTEYLGERSYDEARMHPRRCGCGRFVTRPEQCDGPPCPFQRGK